MPSTMTTYVGHCRLEHQALNQENLGSNPLAAISELLQFSFIPHCHSSLSCTNEYLATDRGGYWKK